MIFIIGWHSRPYMKNNYLIFISIAYLFIGFIDLIHTLSFTGMNIFTDYDFYANQLWIAARYMESITLLLGFAFLNSKKELPAKTTLIIYTAITTLIILSIFVWKVFPICFIKGVGQTTFKLNSEYIICIILICSLYLLYRNKSRFTEQVYRYMMYSISYTIVAELAFTFYISNYGLSNLVGHYFKIFAFYCIYKSVIKTGLEEPQAMIFKELMDKERLLIEANRTRDKFFSIFMHDMTGPINSLDQFLYEAKQDIDDFSREDLIHMMDAGHRSVSSLKLLLDNLYTWVSSQMDGSKTRTTNINLLENITEAVTAHESSANSKNIQIIVNVDNSLFALANKELFKSVVRNVVNNAIKFTKESGTITLSTLDSDDFINVIIEDNGIGIPAEKLESLFNSDNRYTTRGTNNEQGSGFGLKICKDLLEEIGGKMNIESELNHGTKITISLRKTTAI